MSQASAEARFTEVLATARDEDDEAWLQELVAVARRRALERKGIFWRKARRWFAVEAFLRPPGS